MQKTAFIAYALSLSLSPMFIGGALTRGAQIRAPVALVHTRVVPTYVHSYAGPCAAYGLAEVIGHKPRNYPYTRGVLSLSLPYFCTCTQSSLSIGMVAGLSGKSKRLHSARTRWSVRSSGEAHSGIFSACSCCPSA